MADIKRKFGTAGQALSITLASLANDAARQSTEIDNTSDLYLDALVMLKLKSGASGVSSNGCAFCYAYGTVNDGTTRTENAGSSDAALSLVVPTALRLVGSIPLVANATTYVGGPWSVAAAFGGVLPAKWGIVVLNLSQAALDSTAGNHSAIWQGVWGQV